jgi:hypothetical protein
VPKGKPDAQIGKPTSSSMVEGETPFIQAFTIARWFKIHFPGRKYG